MGSTQDVNLVSLICDGAEVCVHNWLFSNERCIIELRDILNRGILCNSENHHIKWCAIGGKRQLFKEMCDFVSEFYGEYGIEVNDKSYTDPRKFFSEWELFSHNKFCGYNLDDHVSESKYFAFYGEEDSDRYRTIVDIKFDLYRILKFRDREDLFDLVNYLGVEETFGYAIERSSSDILFFLDTLKEAPNLRSILGNHIKQLLDSHTENHSLMENLYNYWKMFCDKTEPTHPPESARTA